MSDAPSQIDRRSFVWWSSGAMVGGLVAAYGTLAGFLGRFLYPAHPDRRNWLFVQQVARIPPGAAMVFRLPNGSPVNITRRGQGTTDADFIALSSTCPHLGCQVHWEAQNRRFFCPCHNGVFTPEGKAIAGPPAEAGQSLLQFPLKVERGLLFIEAPQAQLAAASTAGCQGCSGRPQAGKTPAQSGTRSKP